MDSVIVPVIKNKNKRINDNIKYRQLSSYMSVHCLLEDCWNGFSSSSEWFFK